MLTHGAKHLGGFSVPAIRVGVGGHRSRRTSQLALIRPLQHARGLLNASGPTRQCLYLTAQTRGKAPSPRPSPRKRGEGAERHAESQLPTET